METGKSRILSALFVVILASIHGGIQIREQFGDGLDPFVVLASGSIELLGAGDIAALDGVGEGLGGDHELLGFAHHIHLVLGNRADECRRIRFGHGGCKQAGGQHAGEQDLGLESHG